MSKKDFWLSYDLGLDGDYEGLYTWLDKHNARECGKCLAVINDYGYSGDFISFLKEDLSLNIKIDEKTRIYIIYRDNLTKKIKGKFIFGKRVRSPWRGYYIKEVEEEGEEIG